MLGTMILDRLSVLTDEVSDTFTEALDWAVKNGFTWVEVRMVDGANVANLTDAQADRAAAEVRRRGLKVSAIASPIFKCALDPSRPVGSGDLFGAKEEGIPAHFAKLPRAAKIAKTFGTRGIRIFSFWREKEPARYVDEIVAHLKKAADVAEKEDVLLLQENETACNGGYAAEIAELVRKVDRPRAMRALWDPGNETYGGKSPFPEGYRHVKDLLAHVHLKDAVMGADGKPACVPIGSGQAPLLPQIQALEKDGYKGVYTLETRYTPPGGTAMQGTEATLAGLKKLLQAGGLA
jgi:sugar phosphate isomerase/epimerase